MPSRTAATKAVVTATACQLCTVGYNGRSAVLARQSAAAEAETPVGERSDTKTMACVAPLPPIVRPSAAQLITSSP